MSVFSNRLKEAMEIRGIKASDLARASGVCKSSISMYLSEVSEPKPKNVLSLANALRVNDSWLMGKEGAPMDPPVEENPLLDEKRRRAWDIVSRMSDEKIAAIISLAELDD